MTSGRDRGGRNDPGRQRGGLGIARGEDDTGLGKPSLLGDEVLRVAAGAAHGRDDGEPAAVTGGLLPGRLDRARQRAGGIGDGRRSPSTTSSRMTAVDGSRGRGRQVLVAEAWIDHRMRSTDGVLVIAEIDDLVELRALRPERRAQDELRLARQ